MIEIMKKGIALTFASVVMISSLPTNVIAATNTSVELKLKAPLVNIQVKDEDGAQVSGSTFELYNSSNKKLASWESGNESKAVCVDGVQVVTGSTKNEYNIDFESLLGTSIQGVMEASYRPTSKEYFYWWIDDMAASDAVKTAELNLDYNKNYEIKAYYYQTLSTEITIPENTVGVLDNSPNSVGVRFELGNSNSISAEYNETKVPVYHSMSAGSYRFGYGLQDGTGYIGGDYLTVSDKTTEYFKKKIHLGTEFPNLFTDKGEIILSK